MSVSSGSTRRSRANHLTKRVGKYYMGRTIGEGTYAKVKYAQHMETGTTVAIKVVDKEHLVRTRMVAQVKKEIAILQRIQHPNVVNLVEVMSSKDKIFMVMELVTGGDLFDKIAAEGPMKEAAAKALFAQLLGALGYCHTRGIYHRDLKPENVLLSSSGEAKLSDFGLGCVRQESTLAHQGLLNTACGTPNYVAPEVLAKQGYDGAAADVWSLGVVLFVVLAGCLPFDEEDMATLFHKISAAEYEVPPWLSAEAVDILRAMLRPEPAARAPLDALWDHPWMSGVMQKSKSSGKDVAAPFHGSGRDAEGSGTSADNVFQEIVEPETVAARSAREPSRAPRRLNAFELINDYLDISAIFEERDDVVMRHTRFTTAAEPEVVLTAIENAAVAVGGRVERKTPERVRVHIPNRKGAIRVAARVFDVLPGKRIVDVAKVKGNTVEFYTWYHELITALGSLVTHRSQPIVSRPGAESKELTQRRINAFELIASSLNLGALFEVDEEATARHVHFTSRAAPQDIIHAISEGIVALGGRVDSTAAKSAVLVARCSGGRKMRLSVRMFELLPGVHVVQITKESGSLMELYRLYNKLAVQYLAGIMIRRKDGTAAHPRAMTARSLASVSARSDGLDGKPEALSKLSLESSSAGDSSGAPGTRSHSLTCGSADLPAVLEGVVLASLAVPAALEAERQ